MSAARSSKVKTAESSGQGRLETTLQLVSIEVAANENEPGKTYETISACRDIHMLRFWLY